MWAHRHFADALCEMFHTHNARFPDHPALDATFVVSHAFHGARLFHALLAVMSSSASPDSKALTPGVTVRPSCGETVWEHIPDGVGGNLVVARW